MTAAINAPADTRPPEFDARVMSYYPHLGRFAYKLTNNKAEQEELLQETIAYILSHWTPFRPDGGFYNWITLVMRHVAQNGRRKAKVRSRYMPMVQDDRAMGAVSVPPTQIDFVSLRETLREIAPGRTGDILVRRAMGETLDVIGKDLGIGKERVRQIESKERDRLRARAA
jgi:RNA polymerase sigma factor (sigma-70 family)